MIASAQGSRVYWGGRYIGRITSAKGGQAVGGEYDCTSLASPVVGSGANTRVVTQMNPVSIAPAVVTLELLGGSQFVRDDLGRVMLLVIMNRSGTLSGQAYLQDFSIDAVVGEKVKSTAVFKFTGF